mmetsp:Transcript_9428/g.14442  ORF Transcript_9428/g.14442 Transcript_9428/m.14442 type:complete len:267 (-) Transcript_9428:635-1435(-)
MVHTQLSKKLSGILGGVHREHLRDDLEGLGELGDGQLLSGSKGTGVFVKVDGKSNFDGTATGNDGVGLKHSLDDTERVVQRSLNLLKEEVVGTSEDDGLSSGLAHALEEHVLPVTNSLLVHSLASSESLGLEGLLTLDVGQGHNNLGSGVVGDSLQVVFGDASNGDHTSLHEVLEGEVVDSTGAEDDVSAGSDNLVATVLADIHLSLSDLVEGFGVVDENLDAHSEAVLVEVEVNASNLSTLDRSGHALSGSGSLDGVAVNELGVL